MSDFESSKVALEDGEIDEGSEPSASTSSPDSCVHESTCPVSKEATVAVHKSNGEINAVNVSTLDLIKTKKSKRNKERKKRTSQSTSKTQEAYVHHDDDSNTLDDDEMLCVRGASPPALVVDRHRYSSMSSQREKEDLTKDTVSPPKRRKTTVRKHRRKRTNSKKISKHASFSSDDDQRDLKLLSSSSPLSSPQEKLHQLCKFYLQSTCAKGRTCEYMHSEFPCKFFYMGLRCEDEVTRGSCRLSHGGSLSDEMMITLKRHIHSAPNDVLGLKFIELRDKLTLSETHEMLHQMQDRLRNSENESDESTPKVQSNFVASLREKLFFLSEEQIDKLQQLNISKVEDLLSLTLAQLNVIGIHAIQIEAIQMSIIAAKDTDMRIIFPPPLAMPVEPKVQLEYAKDVDIRQLVVAPDSKWYEQDDSPLVIDESNEVEDQDNKVDDIFVEVVKTPSPMHSDDKDDSTDEALVYEITPTEPLLMIAEQYHNDTLETEGTTSVSTDTTLDLFLAECENSLDVDQQANVQLSVGEEQSYGSTPIEEDRSDTPQLLKILAGDALDQKDKSSNRLETPTPSVDEPHIGLELQQSSNVGKVAQNICENHPKHRLEAEKTEFRFGTQRQVYNLTEQRLENNPFHRQATSANDSWDPFFRSCTKRDDVNLHMQGDNSSEDWDADEQQNNMNSAADVQQTKINVSQHNADDETTPIFSNSPCPDFPLRTPNLDNYKPALEIDAHLTYPAMEYRLFEILLPRYEVNKPTFVDKLVKANSSDPRLKRFLEKEKNFGIFPQADYSFFPPGSNTVCDPRLRPGFTNSTCPEQYYNSSPILYGYLQRSLWYQNLKSNLKIQINHSVSDLVRALNAFHKDSSQKVFDLFQIECVGVLLEVMQNVGIFVDVDGNIIQTSNYQQLCAPQQSTSQPPCPNLNGSNNLNGAGPPIKPGLLGYAPPEAMYNHSSIKLSNNEKSFAQQAFGKDYQDYNNNNGMQPPESGFYIRERNVNRNCGGGGGGNGSGGAGTSSDFQLSQHRRPQGKSSIFKRRI